MISRLPTWVWSGAWILAFIAGLVNVVGFLGFEHQALSHVTGITSMLGAAIGTAEHARAGYLVALLLAFVLGCVFSGFIVQDSTLQLGHRYGLALGLAALLLFVSVPLLWHQSRWGMYLAACACGLQNAMVSAYSGSLMRTSHLSGMFTDLGIYIGHLLRGLPVDMRRLQLSLTVISGFLCGGIAGAVTFTWIGYSAILVPASLMALTALSYGLLRIRHGRTQSPRQNQPGA